LGKSSNVYEGDERRKKKKAKHQEREYKGEPEPATGKNLSKGASRH